ncbi:hypothetical protein GALMADRAFT_604134 [Galerina marginata CBS 339.88]|uniref:Uncharacterized protein n=1 Tax=Galerina marginata (strain CBS 339.88) TaxID=685588 RepID=A0A067T521_GALM3|nr:hypothetical protein GALMADRAFT_604134 [Galerina marginata CBS 339.88]
MPTRPVAAALPTTNHSIQHRKIGEPSVDTSELWYLSDFFLRACFNIYSIFMVQPPCASSPDRFSLFLSSYKFLVRKATSSRSDQSSVPIYPDNRIVQIYLNNISR